MRVRKIVELMQGLIEKGYLDYDLEIDDSHHRIEVYGG